MKERLTFDDLGDITLLLPSTTGLDDIQWERSVMHDERLLQKATFAREFRVDQSVMAYQSVLYRLLSRYDTLKAISGKKLVVSFVDFLTLYELSLFILWQFAHGSCSLFREMFALELPDEEINRYREYKFKVYYVDEAGFHDLGALNFASSDNKLARSFCGLFERFARLNYYERRCPELVRGFLSVHLG